MDTFNFTFQVKLDIDFGIKMDQGGQDGAGGMGFFNTVQQRENANAKKIGKQTAISNLFSPTSQSHP